MTSHIELNCLLEGDYSTFPVKVAINESIGVVKEQVYAKSIDTTEHRILAKNLQLLKVGDVLEFSSHLLYFFRSMYLSVVILDVLSNDLNLPQATKVFKT